MRQAYSVADMHKATPLRYVLPKVLHPCRSDQLSDNTISSQNLSSGVFGMLNFCLTLRLDILGSSYQFYTLSLHIQFSTGPLFLKCIHLCFYRIRDQRVLSVVCVQMIQRLCQSALYSIKLSRLICYSKIISINKMISLLSNQRDHSYRCEKESDTLLRKTIRLIPPSLMQRLGPDYIPSSSTAME